MDFAVPPLVHLPGVLLRCLAHIAHFIKCNKTCRIRLREPAFIMFEDMAGQVTSKCTVGHQ